MVNKIEEAGKEFIENVMKYSFNSNDTRTIANRLLRCFIEGAETFAKNAHEFEFPNENKENIVIRPDVNPEKANIGESLGLRNSIQTEQKVIFTSNAETINRELNEGWRVITTTPVVVSAGAQYGRSGDICFLLERNLQVK